MKPIFTAKLSDNSIFVGGNSYQKTKWLEINKPIAIIYYTLPDGNVLVMKDYSKYFHMVECSMDINGKDKGKQRIEYTYIMGKRNGIITSYRITLMEGKAGKDKFRRGDLTRREYKETDEFIKGLNKNNWR